MEAQLPLLSMIRSDGTFTIGGSASQFVPGSYVLSAPGRSAPGRSAGAGWWLQSARTADGRDILDLPLILTDNSPETTSIVLTFTDRHAALSGSLVTAAGRPAVDYTIIAFTKNREWWRSPFRRVLTTRPATDGAYRLNDLPPGDYYLAALADVVPSEWLDARFLEQIVREAVSVTIGPGERKVQSLQIRGK